MDAIFWIAASGSAWHTLPLAVGKADAICRHFRRLAQAGLWERLLRALARPDAPPAIRALEHWICCACRRATRLRGLRIIALARRLGFLSALKAPSWVLPNPDLAELVFPSSAHPCSAPASTACAPCRKGFLRCYQKLLAIAAGKRRIRRCLQPF